MKFRQNSLILSGLAALMLAGTAVADQKPTSPPVAGQSTGVIGIAVDEVMLVANGWSIRKQMLGKPVYNDKNDRVGRVEDIIVNPDKALSYAIIGAGGFLGVAVHDVAIPISQLKIDRDRFVLPGATRDIIKSLPEFHYAR